MRNGFEKSYDNLAKAAISVFGSILSSENATKYNDVVGSDEYIGADDTGKATLLNAALGSIMYNNVYKSMVNAAAAVLQAFERAFV